MPKALIFISSRLAARAASTKPDESSLSQETRERQKWKASLPLLLSNQVIANCKELTHTSLQRSLRPPRWPSSGHSVPPSQPSVFMFNCQLFPSTFVAGASTCSFTAVETRNIGIGVVKTSRHVKSTSILISLIQKNR